MAVGEILTVANVKDFTLIAALLYVLNGVLKRQWVPGIYYDDQVRRAERAETHAETAQDVADRATRVSEQLVAAFRERERG